MVACSKAARSRGRVEGRETLSHRVPMLGPLSDLGVRGVIAEAFRLACVLVELNRPPSLMVQLPPL